MSSPPDPSLLDPGQIIKRAFIESTGKFRVDAAITAPDGTAIIITDVDDSIKIGNGSGTFATITTTGPKNGLDVNIASGSIPLPSGAATEAKQDVGNTSLASIDSKLTSPIAVSQSGTWTTGRTWNLLNTTDSVNSVQSGTWNINNISGTISLPTGASTSTLQTTGNTSLASIDGHINVNLSTRASESTLSTLNSKIADDYGISSGAIRTASQIGNATGAAAFGAGTTSAQTLRVILPTDQTSIPAAQSGTWNINNISGTISLPTGAATAALQTQPGVDIGDVTINNATGAAAVNIQDGGNIITVDGTVAVTQSTSPWVVAGNVASAATDSGNPVKIGGVFNTASPIFTNGQRGDIQITSRGAQIVAGASDVGLTPINPPVGISGVDGGGLKRAFLTDTSGKLQILLNDSSGNGITSQVNGTKQALDIGIDVSGIQIDPREIGKVITTGLTAVANGTNKNPALLANTILGTVDADQLYTSWGRTFTLNVDTFTPVATTEQMILLIKNPSGSGKTLKIRSFRLGGYEPNANNINYTTWKIYINPTITTNGTSATPIGARQISQNSSVCTFFTTPTISSVGTNRWRTVKVGPNILDGEVNEHYGLWLEPNNNLLIAATVLTSGLPINCTVVFVEE